MQIVQINLEPDQAETMDLLSETLASLKLAQLNIADFRLRAPWGIHTRGFTPGFNLIVREGRCTLRFPDGSRAVMQAGDALLLPKGGYLEYASDMHQPCVPLNRVWEEDRLQALSDAPAAFHTRIWGGEGSACRITGFAFELSESSEDLILPQRPQVILQPLPHELDPILAALDTYLEFAHEDSPHASLQGQLAERARFAEGVVISQLRQHILRSDSERGWIAGVKHPKLSPGILAIHKNYADGWSLASLASLCGMSRASFAHHFAGEVGQTPMQYLAEWRARKACALLQTSGASLAQVAYQVGFESEDSLRRNIKRLYGKSPRQLRAGTRPE